MLRDDLPRFEDLPIPPDVTPGVGWSSLMLEISDHIGPYATLQLIDALGGETFRVSRSDAQHARLSRVMGSEAASTFQRIFQGGKIDIPLGREAVFRARAKPIVEQVRDGLLTVADAARILRARRSRIHELLREGESQGAPPRKRVVPVDPRQIVMFPDA